MVKNVMGIWQCSKSIYSYCLTCVCVFVCTYVCVCVLGMDTWRACHHTLMCLFHCSWGNHSHWDRRRQANTQIFTHTHTHTNSYPHLLCAVNWLCLAFGVTPTLSCFKTTTSAKNLCMNHSVPQVFIWNSCLISPARNFADDSTL